MAAKKIVINDSPILATVRVHNALTNEKEELFIMPFSRVEIEDKYTVDPITFNSHPRIVVA